MIMKILILLTIIYFSISQEQLHSITEFRSSPLGISMKEGIFEVSLGLPENSRPLAYIDFDSDRK